VYVAAKPPKGAQKRGGSKTHCPKFEALQAYYVIVVEDRPILSAEYRLPLSAKTDPCNMQRGLSAMAELLVLYASVFLSVFMTEEQDSGFSESLSLFSFSQN